MQSRKAAIAILYAGLVGLAVADKAMRIGHTTLLLCYSNPDDRGMYPAAIDPTHGYAYFLGNSGLGRLADGQILLHAILPADV